MSPNDAMFNQVMIADDASADSGKAIWPAFPGERPAKQKLIAWIDAWEDDLNTAGFSALLRGELPFECQKLKPRDLLSVPVDADPLRVALYAEKNAQIQFDNEIKKDECDARILECKNRLAAKLKKALRPSAPLLLGRLLAKHGFVDKYGGQDLVVPDAYDGVAMFHDIKAMLIDQEVSRYDLKTYQKLYEKIRDTPLKANVSPDDFSARVNAFTVKVNPFLEIPLEDKRLSRFILDQLPASLGSDVRAIVRELDKEQDEWDDVSLVTARCMSLVEQAYDPTLLTTPLANVESIKKMVESSVKAATVNLRLPAAGVPAPTGKGGKGRGRGGGNSGRGGGRGGDTADTPKKKLGKMSRLPDGRYCAKGTCNFDHDTRKPGSECFRDPNYEGPLPVRAYDNPEQLARIEADRQENAVRMGVKCKPLKPPTDTQRSDAQAAKQSQVVEAQAVVAQDGDLLDLFSASGIDFSGVWVVDEDDSQLDVLFESPVSSARGYDLSDRFSSPEEALFSPEWRSHDTDEYRQRLEAENDPELISSQHAWNLRNQAIKDDMALQSNTVCQVVDCSASGCDTRLMFPAPSQRVAESVEFCQRVADSEDLASMQVPSTIKVEDVRIPAPQLKRETKGDTEPASPQQSFLPSSVIPPVPLMEPGMLEWLVRVTIAIGVVGALLAVVLALVYTCSGLHGFVLQVGSGVCCLASRGTSFARALAFTTAQEGLPPMCKLPSVPRPDLAFLVMLLLLAYVIMWVAESALVTALVSCARRGFRGLYSLVDGRALRRRARASLGFAGVILCLILLFNEVGGMRISTPTRTTQKLTISQSTYVAARSTVAHIPGRVGDKLRFILDDLSVQHLNYVPAPVFLNGSDTARLRNLLNCSEGTLDVGDSGAAVHVEIDASRAILGSVRPNTLAVHTANGSVVPPFKCDVRRELGCADGSKRSVLLRDCLIMNDCSHNLISLGKLAREENISCTLGAGDGPSFLSLPDSATVPILNMGIIIIPPGSAKPGAFGVVRAVARGARMYKTMPQAIVHARGNHAHSSVLRNWHLCTDVPHQWTQSIKEEPCDACLKGVSNAVPSNRQAPKVAAPGDLLSYDVYSMGVKHVHGGQHKVFGIHDSYSTLTWVKLMQNETGAEIALALREFRAYCNSHKVVIRHIHTDNAKAHLSDEVTSLIRDDFKARYTTIAPDTPRSNGTMERQWRTMGEATVRMLSKANMPRNFAWYALRQAVDVRNTLPITDSPTECALSRFTGSKPSATHFRVWGCVVYAKVFHRVSKMADQAVRCVHLGRAPNQSGYLCFDPATKQMHVSVHCRFVESAVPGLTLSKDGWQEIVPEFSDEYDPFIAPYDETVLVDQDLSNSGEEPLPLIQGGDGATKQPVTQGDNTVKQVRLAQEGRTRGADGLGPNGGPALAHERPLRSNVQYDAERQAQSRKGVLARLVAASAMSLSQGGKQPHDANNGWLSRLGERITPFANSVGDNWMMVSAVLAASASVDMDDPLSLARGMAGMYLELDDASQREADYIIREAAPLVCSMVQTGPVNASLTTTKTASDPSIQVNAVAHADRNSDDNPSYKRAMSGTERHFWQEACDAEVENFENHHIFVPVPEDSLPTWNTVKNRASEVVDMMWVLKKKYNQLRELLKHKARGTIRGDQEVSADTARGLQPEQTFAPTVRHNTLKLLIASYTARAAQGPKLLRTRYRSFDVPAAFLHGESSQDGRERHIRPPPGYRRYDRRGVPIVWKLTGNCYGRCAAPRIWYETIHNFLMQEVKMKQSDQDPCYYYKVYEDGTRLDLSLFVDDSWVCDDAGARADADLKLICDKFNFAMVEDPKHFLGMNVVVESETRVKLSSEAYILRMADKYVPSWRTRPKLQMPAQETLSAAYEKALLREHTHTKEQLKEYGGKVGALVYTSPCVRADACATISRLSRAITFPTPEMQAIVDDVIVYLAQTASDGITFDGHAENAAVLEAYSDSDWAVGHSTTGWVCFLSGVGFAYASKRQACIAMSSTEAEIIAASACAVEVVHYRKLLEEMGLPQREPTPLYVDNSGAVELSRDRKSCHRSRHVDRRYFKVRELAAEGHLWVEHVDTVENPADILTKTLKIEAYTRHRKRVMNIE